MNGCSKGKRDGKAGFLGTVTKRRRRGYTRVRMGTRGWMTRYENFCFLVFQHACALAERCVTRARRMQGRLGLMAPPRWDTRQEDVLFKLKEEVHVQKKSMCCNEKRFIFNMTICALCNHTNASGKGGMPAAPRHGMASAYDKKIYLK